MSEDTMGDALTELKKRADALKPKYPETTLRAFLEETPPDTHVYITDLSVSSSNSNYIVAPQISLYCVSDDCDGPRGFKPNENLYYSDTWRFEFLKYSCRNCGTRLTRFAIGYIMTKSTNGAIQGTFIKLGQIPSFGPHTPAKVITLIGPDREIFLQGRRAENRGMGIGAFAYYRRVVENQKNRIIGEIAKVAKVLDSTTAVDALFAASMDERQFSKSIDLVKDVIPQSLMISGHNPLTLLHSALSKGLHDEDMTDALCLQKAQSIRTILVELAERSATALKNDKDIQSALSVLLSTPKVAADTRVSTEAIPEHP